MESQLLAVDASGLSLRTRRGPVYGPIDLAIAPGEIAMLVGPTGSGKTALLLTLTGRMRPSAGTLRVAGVDARRRTSVVRARTALGIFPGLSELPDALTVRETVRAEFAMHGRTATPARIAATLSAVDLEVSDATKVGDLSAGELAILGIALALVPEPTIIAVDDFDLGLTPSEHAAVFAVLRSAADRGVTVIGSCVDPRAAVGADLLVAMSPLSESEVAEYALAQSR